MQPNGDGEPGKPELLQEYNENYDSVGKRGSTQEDPETVRATRIPDSSKESARNPQEHNEVATKDMTDPEINMLDELLLKPDKPPTHQNNESAKEDSWGDSLQDTLVGKDSQLRYEPKLNEYDDVPNNASLPDEPIEISSDQLSETTAPEEHLINDHSTIAPPTKQAQAHDSPKKSAANQAQHLKRNQVEEIPDPVDLPPYPKSHHVGHHTTTDFATESPPSPQHRKRKAVGDESDTDRKKQQKTAASSSEPSLKVTALGSCRLPDYPVSSDLQSDYSALNANIRSTSSGEGGSQAGPSATTLEKLIYSQKGSEKPSGFSTVHKGRPIEAKLPSSPRVDRHSPIWKKGRVPFFGATQPKAAFSLRKDLGNPMKSQIRRDKLASASPNKKSLKRPPLQDIRHIPISGRAVTPEAARDFTHTTTMRSLSGEGLRVKGQRGTGGATDRLADTLHTLVDVSSFFSPGFLYITNI